MSVAIKYKTSIFVHCSEPFIFNDLTNRTLIGDEDDIALLARLADSPNTLRDISSFPDIKRLNERLEFFLRENLLVPVSNDETMDFIPHRVDIETCRQCNSRCQFCPQSVSPKSRGVMPLDLFSLILSRLEGATLEWVAFNHYNEPLIDPFFRRRVGLLRERNIPLALFTNGILMKDDVIDFLAEGGVYKIVFNFPSIEPSEWCQLMQMPEQSYWKARRAIESSLKNNSNILEGIVISVNGVTDTQARRAQGIKDYFSPFGDFQVRVVPSNSRAGAIRNELVQISSHAACQRYGGCDRIVSQLHISTEGKVYLCCQDYDQNVILGDIREESISAIMSGPLARQLRAEIYGLTPMENGRLCLNCNSLRQSRFL
jgi:sulfatase maturation enzyme AslB (radical SAM superfamily)